jgi:hypothetical protein
MNATPIPDFKTKPAVLEAREQEAGRARRVLTAAER